MNSKRFVIELLTYELSKELEITCLELIDQIILDYPFPLYLTWIFCRFTTKFEVAYILEAVRPPTQLAVWGVPAPMYLKVLSYTYQIINIHIGGGTPQLWVPPCTAA